MKAVSDDGWTGVVQDFLVRHGRWLLILPLGLSFVQFWLTRYIPSMDGPQHLYNANVLVELIRGNDFFREFFRINDLVVGYWTSHLFLALFKLFLPAWMAEKVFLTLYAAGMFLSFRYLVRSLRPGNGNFITWLIFPFIFHTYLLLGYYAFSVAVIFYFLALGYWIRHREELQWKHMALLGALGLGIFLSHALVFVFFGITFLLLSSGWALSGSLSGHASVSGRKMAGTLWRSALALLPAAILWLIYIREVMEINSTITAIGQSFRELVKELMRIRLLVGFHHQRESPAYIPLFVLIVILCIIWLHGFIRDWKRSGRRWYSLLDPLHIWILVCAVYLGLFFFAPARISAGSLTSRFGLFFFLGLVLFLSVQKFHPLLQILTILTVLFSMGYARIVHHGFIKEMNKDITEIQEVTPYMEKNSTALYINTSPNWIHIHFQLYSVDNVPVVHLQDPQCAGQFPVEWNRERIPRCYVGTDEFIPARLAELPEGERRVEQVDYITVFYQEPFWSDEENGSWQQIIREHYTPVVTGSRGLITLYRRVGLNE